MLLRQRMAELRAETKGLTGGVREFRRERGQRQGAVGFLTSLRAPPSCALRPGLLEQLSVHQTRGGAQRRSP